MGGPNQSERGLSGQGLKGVERGLELNIMKLKPSISKEKSLH